MKTLLTLALALVATPCLAQSWGQDDTPSYNSTTYGSRGQFTNTRDSNGNSYNTTRYGSRGQFSTTTGSDGSRQTCTTYGSEGQFTRQY